MLIFDEIIVILAFQMKIYRKSAIGEWKSIMVFVCFVILFQNNLEAQKSKRYKSFQSLSRPEKCWAIKHIFIAGKTFEISTNCQAISEQYATADSLDGDINGGQVDAFKHAYWMASLVQKIHWRKAKQLGKSREKGSYLRWKKGIQKGKGNLPDKAGSEMDLWNNLQGIEIGQKNKNLSSKELQQLVVEAILSGKMKIIKKNTSGQFLDKESKIIHAKELVGTWENEKVLVPSNFNN